MAVDYIKSHLKNRGFFEDPKLAGCREFALKVTYWKDSELPLRKNGKPAYPVVYTLAHVQNLRALKSASFLLKDDSLKNTVEEMLEFLFKKLTDNKNGFYLAIDKKGPVSAVSSDLLQILFYLDKKDIERFDKNIIKKISKAVKILETPIGFRTLEPKIAKLMKNKYHAETLWPYEQALIFQAAKKFKLKKIARVALRVKKVIKNDYPEIFILKNKKIEKGGCSLQLWTWAASRYFKRASL